MENKRSGFGNDAAFPQPELRRRKDGEVLAPAQWGLTKLEYFAAAALQGIMSKGTMESPADAAIHAASYAEALAGELEKRTRGERDAAAGADA